MWEACLGAEARSGASRPAGGVKDLGAALFEMPLGQDADRAFEKADSFLEETGLGEAAASMDRAALRQVCASLLVHSPFLTHILRRHGTWLPAMAAAEPSAYFDDLIARTGALSELTDQADLMRELRLAKLEAALLIALCDITKRWSLEQVTGALTRFADTAVQMALRWAFARAVNAGTILGRADGAPASLETSGLTVLGMGKYGAGELNYSSDIDLVVFFEPGVLTVSDDSFERDVFVKLTQKLVKLLQERTEDGYVFRVDLRLRPDPGGTAVAVSLPAAEQYYESRGQNWERAAFIKARHVAGDPEVGAQFLSLISPFVWRRHLDFAAIDDIHSMKRQIHAVGGHGVIAVAGHNVKLGRGGIREIEFFVQTQQLIAGGRERSLRSPRTLEVLDRLEVEGWITAEARDELKQAYRFLRTLEHRLQMVDDEQTHTLPTEPEKLARIASFMGFPDLTRFEERVTAVLSGVQGHYVALFEKAPPLGEEGGGLVFTGTEDDPETLETLRGLGFTQVEDISERVRDWHRGVSAATRSPRSREMLTALMPALMRALGRTANPDTAFARFDSFLKGLPAGVQLFSMLYSNPHLLGLIADICGTAPRLADYLSHNPTVLEAVIDPSFFSVLPDVGALRASLSEMLANAQDFQDQLDFARIWAREHRFRLGVRLLSASADAAEAGAGFAAIAEALIGELAPIVEDRVAERHGRPKEVSYAVLAMGKLGGREMTSYSDLDLIMIYDVPDGADITNDQTDGRRPISIPQFYARLCQQIISALTVPTSEGQLYEVDMRLRPSGNAGPLATRLASFVSYQENEAWTWEQMALTRARVVSGRRSLARSIRDIVSDVLCRPRDEAALRKDVLEMRARLAKEFATDNAWELKQVRGGLVEIEFITQYLQLLHAHAHPEILDQNTEAALMKIRDARLIDSEDAEALLAAARLHHDLTQVTRLCLSKPLDPYRATAGLKALLARTADAPDFIQANQALHHAQYVVREIFTKLIGEIGDSAS